MCISAGDGDIHNDHGNIYNITFEALRSLALGSGQTFQQVVSSLNIKTLTYAAMAGTAFRGVTISTSDVLNNLNSFVANTQAATPDLYPPAFLTTYTATGTLALRPAAGSVNNNYRYLATDNGVTYRSDGASWIDVLAGNTNLGAVSSVNGRTGVVTGLAESSDSRLSNARTPTAHHTSHEVGGSDPLTSYASAPAITVVATSGAAQTVTAVANGEAAYDITLTANCTITLAGSPAAGKVGALVLRLTQDATGSRTVTWPASVRWAGAGTAPTLSTGSAKYDKIVLQTWDGGVSWDGALVAQGYFVPTTPGAPTGLGATPGNTQNVLAWTAPASNGGSGITGYKVYRSTTTGTETLLTTIGNVLTYTDTGLTNATQYFYKVAAVNGVGTGTLSSEASGTPSGTTTYLTETWNRTATSGALGTCDTGQTWVHPNSGTPTMDCTPNYASVHAGQPGSGVADQCYIDTGHADFSVSWTITKATANQRFYFRLASASHPSALWTFGSGTGFYNQSGNVGGTTVAFADGDVIKVTCAGSVITMYQNGVQIKQITDSTNSTNTCIGIGMVPTGWQDTTARFGRVDVTS